MQTAVLWPTTRTAGYIICYQWFKQRLILSVSEPSISQRSQIKEDTVEPSVPARGFKAYYKPDTCDPARLGFELRPHRSP